MNQYSFDLIAHENPDPLADKGWIDARLSIQGGGSLADNAKHFIPGEQLATAINTAIAVGEPLLITGEPGTGKTQAAYYAAYKLGLEPVIHFQVKSDSSARDLLYHFDTVRYFHDAHLVTEKGKDAAKILGKADYVERRALWEAFQSAEERREPRVLLIDEIDKAPRDFPNDLLHELDQKMFTVIETGKEVSVTKPQLAPIVFITSNSERRLPEPFLRRCVYHHIRFDDTIVQRAVAARKEQGQFDPLADTFIEMALQRFLALRERGLRKKPATGELLVWLRVLALAVGTYPEKLDQKDLSRLPYLGALLKDHQDLEEVGAGGKG